MQTKRVFEVDIPASPLVESLPLIILEKAGHEIERVKTKKDNKNNILT